MSEHLAAGTTVGNYRIASLLGSGAMGDVYEGVHTHLGRRAAVKVLRAELVRNPTVARRFEIEARAINAAGHPNIVELADAGVFDGRKYIVMELLAGETLEARLERQHRLSRAPALHIALQIADALALAHERGIVHRDLKPANIFLLVRGGDDDYVKLLDFGIAKFVGVSDAAEAQLTAHGMIVGTPQYMSPEQCTGEDSLDHRSDIYSLGVMLYQMLTGSLPWKLENHSFMRFVMAHANLPPVPPRQLVPELSPALESVLLQMLAKSPADRPQDMRAVKRALAPAADAREAIGNVSVLVSAELAQQVAPGAALPPDAVARKLVTVVLGSIHAGQVRLPSMPAAAVQCLGLLRRPDPAMHEVVKILGRDPILTPQILVGANAALFAGGSRVKTLDQAVLRLGARQLTSVLIEASARTLFESRDPQIRRSFQLLWDHSVAVAVVARALARRVSADADLAYLAGLLHDIGKPVTAAVLLEAERVAHGKKVPWHTVDVWRELVTRCHREVGFALARVWSLPDEVLMTIARSDRYTLDASAAPVNLVCLANALVKRAGIHAGQVDPAQCDAMIADGMALLGLDQPAITEALAQLGADTGTQDTVLAQKGTVLSSCQVLPLNGSK